MRIAGLNLGSSSPNPVPEYAAEGEIERVYHEVRQSLRVTGVNLIFRTWAAYPKFLAAMWDQARPNVETASFEHAASQIREEALHAVESFPQAELLNTGELGESRADQIRAALELYHTINPRLLVLALAVRLALQGERIGAGAPTQIERIQRGEPARMYPMEMEEERPDDRGLRRTLRDIQRTLALPEINSDYRTLALWPDYLDLAWRRLKPLSQNPEFRHAADLLRERARLLAAQLPYPLALSLGRVKELGEDADQVLETTRSFEQLLPGLILSIATLRQDWERTAHSQTAASTPAPAAASPSTEPAWRAFQKRQRLVELDDCFLSYVDEGTGEAVVLLHGIPTWGFLWERTLAALSPRYRVVAPDLLGYGYSAKRDRFDRSLARQTELLAALLDRLQIPAAHLVGHDIGGGIALRLATLFPQKVRSLCLMNSVCYDSWPVDAMIDLGLPTAASQLPPAKTLKTLKQRLGEAFGKEPAPDWLDGLLSPWRTEAGRLSLVRNAAALNTSHTTEITRLLPGIKVPALVLWGEDDPFQLVKYGERLANDIPNATLARIPAARHFVMLDQPARVHQHLEEFLGRQSAAALPAAA